MDALSIKLQVGVSENAEVISALAIQVFLDTYATDGVRPDLAAEVFSEYSKDQFYRRLEEPDRLFVLAKQDDGIVGFAEFNIGPISLPGQDGEGAELVRLYVQPKSQQHGIGQKLLAEVERIVLAYGGNLLWFTVWENNERALSFYRANGYRDSGATEYEFQSNVYKNKVLSKALVEC
jgi:ribosomal protein S18 acetylase RimI-like enzyme